MCDPYGGDNPQVENCHSKPLLNQEKPSLLVLLLKSNPGVTECNWSVGDIKEIRLERPEGGVAPQLTHPPTHLYGYTCTPNSVPSLLTTNLTPLSFYIFINKLIHYSNNYNM